MRAGLSISLACLCLCATFAPAADSAGPHFGEPQTQQYRIGVIITADAGPCRGVTATAPVPIDWPEQEVKIVGEEISPLVKKVSYRLLSGTARQMVIEIPQIPAGKEARAIITFEVTRRAILAPESTSSYILPKSIDAKLRPFLTESPYIESRHIKIQSVAKEAIAGKEGAWQQTEAIYDWVRERVQYKEGPLKGALQALADRDGDCEELTSLFIAMCRANNIPARLVWVPGHCYPEFCLQDGQGKQHWFPCQAAGTRAFGAMPEYRPILQKGDNFHLPDRPKEKHRYVSEGLIVLSGRASITPVREPVAAK